MFSFCQDSGSTEAKNKIATKSLCYGFPTDSVWWSGACIKGSPFDGIIFPLFFYISLCVRSSTSLDVDVVHAVAGCSFVPPVKTERTLCSGVLRPNSIHRVLWHKYSWIKRFGGPPKHILNESIPWLVHGGDVTSHYPTDKLLFVRCVCYVWGYVRYGRYYAYHTLLTMAWPWCTSN